MPLATIADEGRVLPFIACAVGVPAQNERDPIDRIAGTLGDRCVFILPDNLEHVLGAAVDIVALLRAVTGMTAFATSRRAPRIGAEEDHHPLPPLPAPPGAILGKLDVNSRAAASGLALGRNLL